MSECGRFESAALLRRFHVPESSWGYGLQSRGTRVPALVQLPPSPRGSCVRRSQLCDNEMRRAGFLSRLIVVANGSRLLRIRPNSPLTPAESNRDRLHDRRRFYRVPWEFYLPSFSFLFSRRPEAEQAGIRLGSSHAEGRGSAIRCCVPCCP